MIRTPTTASASCTGYEFIDTMVRRDTSLCWGLLAWWGDDAGEAVTGVGDYAMRMAIHGGRPL